MPMEPNHLTLVDYVNATWPDVRAEIVAPLHLVTLNRYVDDGEEMVRAIYRKD